MAVGSDCICRIAHAVAIMPESGFAISFGPRATKSFNFASNPDEQSNP